MHDSAQAQPPLEAIRFRRSVVLLLAVSCFPAVALAENLVVNGDLEAGTAAGGKGWSKADGITSFWGRTGGNPGGCLRFVTDVQQSAKRTHLAGKPTPAKPGTGGQYSTVGAHEGVWAFCSPISVEPDDRYFIIEAEVKGPARSTRIFYPQVFVRGYQRYSAKRHGETSGYFHTPHERGKAFSEVFGKAQRPAVAGDLIMVYRHALVCRLAEPGKWSHFRMGIRLPSPARYRPDVLLLKPYAMWPLGEYRFDNIVLRRCTKAEYDEAKKKGHSAEAF